MNASRRRAIRWSACASSRSTCARCSSTTSAWWRRCAPTSTAGEAPPQLDPETETACFRVAQEAITNVLRHAHARNLWLRLFTAGDRLALSVRDDGGGFDPESARRRAHAGGSLGLAGMEERIAIAGGSIELRSQPGHGTVLLATFPIDRAGGQGR